MPFNAFKGLLEKAVRDRGGDLSSGTYHFVVLLNTVRVNGGPWSALSNIYRGMLFRYLVENGTTSDKLTFLPFQRVVREDFSVVGRSYKVSTAGELLSRLPTTVMSDPEYDGGNDPEHAVLEALKESSVTEDISHLIIITLSDTPNAEPPRNNPKYQLAINSPQWPESLKKAGVSRVAEQDFLGGSDTDGPATVYVHFFLPATLTPIGKIASKDRASVVVQQEEVQQKTFEVLASPSPLPASSVLPPSLPTAKPPTDNSRIISTIVGILILLFSLGIGGWFWNQIQKRIAIVAISGNPRVNVTVSKPVNLAYLPDGSVEANPSEKSSAILFAQVQMDALSGTLHIRATEPDFTLSPDDSNLDGTEKDFLLTQISTNEEVAQFSATQIHEN